MPAGEWNILSVTDIHFADRDNRFRDDNKSGIAWAYREDIFPIFHDIVKSGFPDESLDLIAVPGDITTHGKPEGFQKFRDRTLPILKKKLAPGAPGRICLVPGNHDVTWALEPSDPRYFETKFAGYSGVVDGGGVTSVLLPLGAAPATEEETLEFAKPALGPLLIDDDRRLIVLCINSSMRCGEIDAGLRDDLRRRIDKGGNELKELEADLKQRNQSDDHVDRANLQIDHWKEELLKYVLFDVPHVTQAQLSKLREEVGSAWNARKSDWNSYLKIGILHHHLVPFPRAVTEHKPFELLSDAAKVLGFLTDFEFDLVLTGHKHQRYELPWAAPGKGIYIIGGPTVGGYPSGPPQGFRHIRARRDGSALYVWVADLNLDMGNNYEREVRLALDTAKPIPPIGRPATTVRVEFPPLIEQAILQQIYERPFYKTNVLFRVECDEVGSDYVKLVTELSYFASNRTSTGAAWPIQYDFTRTEGEVLEVEVDGRIILRGGQRVDIPYFVQSNRTIQVKVRVRERYDIQDDEFYTSYNPASDLKVVLDKVPAALAFEMESFADGDSRRILVDPSNREVEIRNGLLPYQGIKVRWNRSAL
jgi:3',5'-cyclic AMP phosphodiesterase CpdA